jgi:hypothetical protein
MVFATTWLSLLHYSAAVTSLYTFTLKRAVTYMTIICDIGYTGEPRIGPWVQGEDGTFGRACSLPDRIFWPRQKGSLLGVSEMRAGRTRPDGCPTRLHTVEQMQPQSCSKDSRGHPEVSRGLLSELAHNLQGPEA